MTATRPSVTIERQVRRAQIAVAGTFFVHGLLFASWAAHIPHVKAHLGVADGTLGVALLGAPLGSVSAMTLASWLVPRLGSRRVVQVCLLGYGASGPLVGLVGTVPGLFGALALWGAFQGILDIAMNTQAIAVEHARGRPLMNGMHASWSLGAFAGAGLGSAAVALDVSLARQLIVVGAVALVAVWPSTMRMLPDARERPAVRPPRTRSSLRRLPTAVALLGAIAFASMLCEGAAADWSSVYLRDSLGAQPGVTGLGYTGFTLAMLTVRLLGNRLLRRHDAAVLIPALAAVTTAVFATTLLVDTVPTGVLGFLVLGAGVGIVVPTVFSLAGRLPGIHPGVGVAVVSGLGWAGFVCGPPVIGQLAGVVTLPGALALVPALTAFIAVAARRLRPPTSSTG